MKPFASFLRIEAAGGAILLALTIAALVLSNSPWAHQFLTFWELPVGIQIGSLEAARSLRDWVNDALMTLFWLAAACLPASALHDGAVHCQSGVQRRSHRRCQAGHLVCTGRLRGDGYCAPGLVVFL
jgi:Na+/H+ antiporter NhaA